MHKTKFNSNLIFLLIGRTISNMGTTILMVAMPLYILDIGGSAATVGLLSFAAFLPSLIIYPFAGVIGDRFNRKTIMVITKLGSGATILALTAFAYLDLLTLPLLLSGFVVVSVLNGLFDPASKGILPQLVHRDNLSRANSAVSSLRTLSSLAGPVIGATLYVTVGITVLFAINGICFFISGLCDILMRYIHEKRERELGFFTELTDGFKFIASRAEIRGMCIFLLIIFSLIQPIFSVTLPLFFRTVLDYSDNQYGYLQMIIVAGAFLGSVLVGVLFGKEGKEKKALIIGLFLLMGSMVGFSVLLFPRSLEFLGSGSLVYFGLMGSSLSILSLAVMFINVPVQTIIQKKSPDKYMARIFSTVAMITKGGLPFGALIYGIVLDNVAVYLTISVVTLLMIIVSGAFLASLFGSGRAERADAILSER